MSELENKNQPTSFEPERSQPAPQLPGLEDGDLAEILTTLKPVPERDPLAAARSQARFLSELKGLGLPNTSTSLPGRLNGWLRDLPIGKKKEKTTMSTPAQRFAFSSFALIALIVVFLFGGAGTTVFAAQSALPGDALFRVKTSLEQTQTSLSNSASDRAGLHLEFADRRLNEIERLVAQMRFQDIGSASSEFEAHISAAEFELQAVEKENPEKSVQLSQKISDDLLRFDQTLSKIKHQVPDDVKGEVEHAIQAVQPTPAAGDDMGVDDRGKGTFEPGDDRGTGTPEPGDDKGGSTLEPGDDKGGSTLEPGDDKGGSTLEPGDDKGSSTLEPGDDKGGASGSPTQTPGVDDKSGKSSGGSISATPTPGPTTTSGGGSGSGTSSGSGSSGGGTSGGSGSGSGSGTSGGSGGGSGSGSGGSGGGSGDDGGGHK